MIMTIQYHFNMDPDTIRECISHHYACDCRERQWRMALADAIRRPMGVIPDSALGLVDATDLAKAEWRRMQRPSRGEL